MENADEVLVSVIIFATIGLLVGVLCREINKKYSVPYTPMLILIGILWGLAADYIGRVGSAAAEVSAISPTAILMIFIPAIIFESSFSLDWYTFRRELSQILMLAVPGVAISTGLTAVFFMYVLNYQTVFTLGQAFMLGSILAATDPVAVISLLKELGTSKRFSTIIEGESVVNDGTAMVLYLVAIKYAENEKMDAAIIASDLARLSLGGAALGVGFGVVMSFVLKRIYNDYVLEITITLVTSYLVYFTAMLSGADVSGILCLLALGLYMSAWGKSTISRESNHQIHVIWKFLGYVAETLLFILAGIIIGYEVMFEQYVQLIDWGKLLVFIVLMEVARGLMVLSLYPALYWWGYRVNWRQAIVLTHTGIRGGIALSLALLVQNENLPVVVKHLTLFHTAGIAFFTIMINGTTTKLIMVKLGLTVTSKVEESTLVKVLHSVMSKTKETMNKFRSGKYYSEADWSKVKDLSGIKEFVEKVLQKTSTGEQILRQMKADQQLDIQFLSNYMEKHQDLDANELNIEIRHRYLTLLKGLYWHQYEEGQTSAKAAFVLIESVDREIDHEDTPLQDWEHLEAYIISSCYHRTLVRLRTVPLIGRLANSLLYYHLAFTYELASTFKLCHKKASELIENLNGYDVARKVLSEAEKQLVICRKYIRSNADSISDAVRRIHTNRASYAILNQQSHAVEDYYSQGLITYKELTEMKNFIDSRKEALQNASEFIKPNLFEFMKGLDVLEGVSVQSIKHMVKLCQPLVYKRGELITSDSSAFDGIFLLMRGKVNEFALEGEGRLKHKTGSFMNSQHVLLMVNESTSLISVSSTYVIYFRRELLDDEDFPKEVIGKLKKRAAACALQLSRSRLPNPFSQYIYMEWLEFVDANEFVICNQGTKFNLPSGGILVSGIVSSKDSPEVSEFGVKYLAPGSFISHSLVNITPLTVEVVHEKPQVRMAIATDTMATQSLTPLRRMISTFDADNLSFESESSSSSNEEEEIERD